MICIEKWNGRRQKLFQTAALKTRQIKEIPIMTAAIHEMHTFTLSAKITKQDENSEIAILLCVSRVQKLLYNLKV